MTNREVKNYLRRGFYINKEISCLKERLARIMQQINNCVPSYESDGTQFNQDIRSKEKLLAIYEDSKQIVEDKIIELEEVKNETQRLIDRLDDSRQRSILGLYYIDFKGAKYIQRKLYVSERTMYYCLEDGIEAVRELLERGEE